MICTKCGADTNEYGIYRGWGEIYCLKCKERCLVNSVKIGNKNIGSGNPVYLIAEIGINHNGDIDLAKRLIDIAVDSKWDAVKFQKRTVDIVYTPEELAKPRENPFGNTNGDLKRALELGFDQYKDIDSHCLGRIDWFASVWDEASVEFMSAFSPPCYKIASASLTDDNLLRYTRAQKMPIILSTGMSTLEEVDHAVEVLGIEDLIIMHTCSTYPSSYEDLNLKVIPFLIDRYHIPIGYSGHETGLPSTIAAIALGASVIERHITLDRAMWGSDQAASLSPSGIMQLSRDIRLVEKALGDGKKIVCESEIPVKKKLRRK